MFHLFPALRCIIRSSALLFPVTQSREWKHASHKKSYRFDQENVCMARSASKGRGPNGFSNTAEMRNEQHEKWLHESGRRYEVKTRNLNHKERPRTPQRREQRASKCCHLKPGEAETMAAHFQVSVSRFLYRSSDSLDTEDEDVFVSEASMEMIDFTQISTLSRLVSVMSDSGSVFRFWH